MRYFLLVFLVSLTGCQSVPPKTSLIGSFRGTTVRQPKEPKNGAFTTVYIPTYEVGVVFTENEFSGSQKKEEEEPIIIRGKYELMKKPNTIRFIAEDFANEVVLLDGVFSYTLVEKTLTLTKQDGSLKLVLTRLPER